MIPEQKAKERSSDRILVLKPIDGAKPLSSTGLVDTRLFTGENKLHAIMDDTNCMWRLKYDQGGLPPALKQTFTGFSKLIDYTKTYFKKRNIEIVDILD